MSGQIVTHKITRHYLTINSPNGNRRVHYRKCGPKNGSGPPLLMVHQSPRSSAEYEPLMRAWGDHFTCIAPDTPGFGQSDPLADPAPEINDFADALIEFCDAVGLKQISGYGFHSGGIILVTVMKRHMRRFKTLAIGGYAIWNDEERAKLGPPYIPPNPPKPYGEHLVWLWNRILEQSWYFPWYLPDYANRMIGAHDDVARVHAIILEMLDSGDYYRLGYGAVLRGPRDIPTPDTITPPVLITAYQGDPLRAHLDRLGAMPAGWEAYGVESPQAHWDASLSHLLENGVIDAVALAEDDDAGFVNVETSGFSGVIHWTGPKGEKRLSIHGPGREGTLVADPDAIRVDLPGHGLSSPWADSAPTEWKPWQDVIDALSAHFGTSETTHESLRAGDPDRLFPDFTLDRFGNYLTRAWSIVRAQHLFAPWYLASKNHAIPIDIAALAPERLALEHRALIRSATAAKALHLARLSQ